MHPALEIVLLFVALYPGMTAAVWIVGGLMFRLLEERRVERPTEEDTPGVTILIPAYNEEAVIATSVRAALDSDYPQLEVLVLDDGSADATARTLVVCFHTTGFTHISQSSPSPSRCRSAPTARTARTTRAFQTRFCPG